jgi:1,4-dihydroxy-2-naphthoate polyprenyltransferase
MRDWVEAARPRTLPAAIAPVFVGSGLAMADGVYRNDAFVLALVGALAIQIAANFSNDVSDAARGADTVERVGPTRMVATGRIGARAMWWATGAAVAVAVAAGAGLVLIAGWPIVVIGVASLLAMLTYVGGPIPYGYRGLGEVFVFVFFGLVATVGTRFAHGGSTPGVDAWVLGTVMGCWRPRSSSPTTSGTSTRTQAPASAHSPSCWAAIAPDCSTPGCSTGRSG